LSASKLYNRCHIGSVQIPERGLDTLGVSRTPEQTTTSREIEYRTPRSLHLSVQCLVSQGHDVIQRTAGGLALAFEPIAHASRGEMEIIKRVVPPLVVVQQDIFVR
jgi:hypothetical protein